jgi:hypothetical protein
LNARKCCLNWPARRVGRGKEAAGRGGDRGGAGPGEVEEGGGRKKGEGGAPLTGGAGTSARQEKKKKSRRPWAAAGEGLMGYWATGPKGKRGKFVFFFFFFKLFSKQPFKFKFKSNPFKLFTEFL